MMYVQYALPTSADMMVGVKNNLGQVIFTHWASVSKNYKKQNRWVRVSKTIIKTIWLGAFFRTRSFISRCCVKEPKYYGSVWATAIG
jgi:hypothetical protein